MKHLPVSTLEVGEKVELVTQLNNHTWQIN